MRDSGEEVLYQLFCSLPECGAMFFICRRCYHGHKYCSETCRGIARRRQLDAARRRYRHTIEAKLDQRDRQRRWRLRRGKETVMDQSSTQKRKVTTSIGRDRTNRQPSPRAAVIVVRKINPAHVSGVAQCVICGRVGRFVNPFHLVRSYLK